MHVVSLGEGNVDCGDGHGTTACGDDALHPHETNGVLLLPDQRSRWHAFNVKTLMLPQHGTAVSEHLSQNRIASALLLRVGKASITSTVLLLGIFICIAFILLNAFSPPKEEFPDDPYDEEANRTSSWAEAYREAYGQRREAMELLRNTSIITKEDWYLPSTPVAHIDECVQVALQMLRERPMVDWYDTQAQRAFEAGYSTLHKEPGLDVRADIEIGDGAWSRFYMQSESQPDVQEAVQFLLCLGIVSKDEFRDSLVPRPYIEERVAVALNLLKQQSLREWIGVFEKAQGNLKASVMAQFTTPRGPLPEPQAPPHHSPYQSPHHSPHPPIANPMGYEEPIRTVPTSTSFKRGGTAGLYNEDDEHYDQKDWRGERLFNAEGHSGRTPPAPPTSTFPTSVPRQAETGSIRDLRTVGEGSEVQTKQSSPGLPRTVPSVRGLGQQSTGAAAYMIPVSPMGSTRSPRSMPPAAVVADPFPQRLPTPERPRSLVFGSGTLGRDKSPRSGGNASQGWPVQIKFSNNAVSGSQWEANVTPPTSQMDM